MHDQLGVYPANVLLQRTSRHGRQSRFPALRVRRAGRPRRALHASGGFRPVSFGAMRPTCRPAMIDRLSISSPRSNGTPLTAVGTPRSKPARGQRPCPEAVSGDFVHEYIASTGPSGARSRRLDPKIGARLHTLGGAPNASTRRLDSALGHCFRCAAIVTAATMGSCEPPRSPPSRPASCR